MHPYHFTAGLNRPQADGPDCTFVSLVDAVNYVVGCTGRDRGLVASLVQQAARSGAVFVACDRKQPHTRPVCLVKQDGPVPASLTMTALAEDYEALEAANRWVQGG